MGLGYGSPEYIADTMSPRQILLFFEEAWKHMRRRDADILMLTRAAYHADEINKLMAELTKFDQKEAPGIGPEQLIGMLKGAG